MILSRKIGLKSQPISYTWFLCLLNYQPTTCSTFCSTKILEKVEQSIEFPQDSTFCSTELRILIEQNVEHYFRVDFPRQFRPTKITRKTKRLPQPETASLIHIRILVLSVFLALPGRESNHYTASAKYQACSEHGRHAHGFTC